jgi:integrase
MAREVKRLSARSVTTLSKPGRHSDGAGLYLVIDPSGARRWLFLFRWQGKLKELGLGGIASVTLADARARADEARRLLAAGTSPIEAKRAAEAERKAAKTFGAFADEMLISILPGFKNVRHRAQWTRALKHYAEPIRNKRLDEIGTDDILGILQPLWQNKQETASRVRGRIERVLAAAKAKGLIPSPWENPARWRGHLKELLSQRKKLTRGHHAAMPYAEVPAFIADVRARPATAARALEFAILNASRSNEVLGARWEEIDLKHEIWTVPPERMKGGTAHRVPLSKRAVAIITEMNEIKVNDFVFPGQKRDRPLSSMALEMLMRRMKVSEFTPHGFRSSFRDWAGENTTFPREVAEAALSHTVGDEAEQAYRRGDALEKRRKLMQAWSQYLAGPKAKTDNVTPIRAKRAG